MLKKNIICFFESGFPHKQISIGLWWGYQVLALKSGLSLSVCMCVSANITILPPPCWNDSVTLKHKCKQGWDDMSCQCTSRPLPSAPPGPCEGALSQQWPHCLEAPEFTHSSIHSNVTCISTLHPLQRIPYLLLPLHENILKKCTRFFQINRRVGFCRKGRSVASVRAEN